MFKLNATPAAVGAKVKPAAGAAAPRVFKEAGAVSPEPETAKFCPAGLQTDARNSQAATLSAQNHCEEQRNSTIQR